MFAGDHAAQRARQRHDARHRRVGRLQHLVVVGVDRDVGVHVAVAGVHVQGDEDAAAQHAAGESPSTRSSTGRNTTPSKMASSSACSFVLPGDAHASGPAGDGRASRLSPSRSWQSGRRRRSRITASSACSRFGERQVEMVEQPLPARAHRGDQLPAPASRRSPISSSASTVGVSPLVQRQLALEKLAQRVAQTRACWRSTARC